MADAAEKLKTACDEAFDWEPAKKSCSHAVWYIMKKMANDDTIPYRTANTLIDFLSKASSKWYPIEIDKAHDLANKGILVIGGMKASGNGHVIAVYPGTKIFAGGYEATNSKGTFTVRSRGLFPRALSRSIGSWPGSVSKGDKTVWDPWANDKTFAGVKFWTEIEMPSAIDSAPKSANLQYMRPYKLT